VNQGLNMTDSDVDRVIDLTFLDLQEESEFTAALIDKIQQYRARSPPRRSVSPSATTTTNPATGENAVVTISPSGKSRYAVSDRRTIRAIRLGNNYLPSIKCIFTAPHHLRAENILWLDLSFNHITHISPDICKYFPNVRTIYLHANKISRLSEIKHLEGLTELHSLSLYGNPVEGKKHYRNYTLFICPHLAQFDKSPVTKFQRQKVEVWAATFRKKLMPQEEDEY